VKPTVALSKAFPRERPGAQEGKMPEDACQGGIHQRGETPPFSRGVPVKKAVPLEKTKGTGYKKRRLKEASRRRRLKQLKDVVTPPSARFL